MTLKQRMVIYEIHFWIIVLVPWRFLTRPIRLLTERFEKRIAYLMDAFDEILNGESK